MSDLMFSVLVITYNQEKYIAKTLDSILSQEHNYKYEIVIGEDCSTDGTRAIIESYAREHPSIIKPIYNNPNLGLIKNYFNILSHCTGKYIMECAGDDWWLPGKVEYQIKFMEEHPDVGMCYGQAKQWIEDKHKFSKKSFGSKKETFEEFLQGNCVPAPSVCFRNDLIKKYIDEIDPLHKGWLMEDYPEWLWFAAESRVHFEEKILCVYRVLSKSESHQISLDKFVNFRKSTNEIQNFFSMNYLGNEFSVFNEHLNRAYYYIITNQRCKTINELKLANLKGGKWYLLQLISTTHLIFKLLVLHYRRHR